LYEGTKDPAHRPRISVCQARTAIMIGFRFGNEQARRPRVPFPAETTRNSLRVNLGRMRGQAQ